MGNSFLPVPGVLGWQIAKKIPGGKMSIATEGYMVRRNILLVHGLNWELFSTGEDQNSFSLLMSHSAVQSVSSIQHVNLSSRVCHTMQTQCKAEFALLSMNNSHADFKSTKAKSSHSKNQCDFIQQTPLPTVQISIIQISPVIIINFICLLDHSTTQLATLKWCC